MALLEFKHYREEEQYEVGLAAGRLSSLLASQAFLFTGWAIIHGPAGNGSPKLILIVLPCIALAICVTALLAIVAAVIVIHRWQRHGDTLIADDRNSSNPELSKYHIARAPNDGFHFFGVDLFSVSVPILFCVLWIVLLVHACAVPVQADAAGRFRESIDPLSPQNSPANPKSATSAVTEQNVESKLPTTVSP